MLVFHAYINEMHGSRSKIPIKKLVHIYIYIHDVKFLALHGAPHIYDINRLRVKLRLENVLSVVATNCVEGSPS
jgi:hypothetical protein